jgi:hypothetical protein
MILNFPIELLKKEKQEMLNVLPDCDNFAEQLENICELNLAIDLLEIANA